MDAPERRRGVRYAAATAAVLVPLASGLAAAAFRVGPVAAVPGQGGNDYVGEQVCLSCHQDAARGYFETLHAETWNTKTPQSTQGCESCHGPGKAHADAGGDPTKIRTFRSTAPASESDAGCTSCHTKGEAALWSTSPHETRRLSCVTCHSGHAPKSKRNLLVAATELDVCARCHRGETQKIGRTAHMPLQEGKMACSSCHNPHGATNVGLLRVGNSLNEACVACHADKRGPFLWEHAPVTESCMLCHDPHGSPNEGMLLARAPFLCQRCHVSARHSTTAYDTYLLTNTTSANRIVGRSCVVCHQNIHGSNAPAGSTFLR